MHRLAALDGLSAPVDLIRSIHVTLPARSATHSHARVVHHRSAVREKVVEVHVHGAVSNSSRLVGRVYHLLLQGVQQVHVVDAEVDHSVGVRDDTSRELGRMSGVEVGPGSASSTLHRITGHSRARLADDDRGNGRPLSLDVHFSGSQASHVVEPSLDPHQLDGASDVDAERGALEGSQTGNIEDVLAVAQRGTIGARLSRGGRSSVGACFEYKIDIEVKCGRILTND